MFYRMAGIDVHEKMLAVARAGGIGRGADEASPRRQPEGAIPSIGELFQTGRRGVYFVWRPSKILEEGFLRNMRCRYKKSGDSAQAWRLLSASTREVLGKVHWKSL